MIRSPRCRRALISDKVLNGPVDKRRACLSDPTFLERLLGKMGLVLYTFANGWDESPVSPQGYEAPVKSIGNSTTTPRDLENNLDVQIVLMALAEVLQPGFETWV